MSIYAQPGQSFEAAADEFPSGLTGTLGVRIDDTPVGTPVLARTTAGIVEHPAGSGLYSVVLTAPIAEGVYSIVWDSGGAAPIYAREELRVSGQVIGGLPPSPTGYMSTADLVAASSLPELAALSAARREALRQEAIHAIEDFAGQSFTQEGTVAAPVTKAVDGSGSDVLWLPKRLASLVSVTIAGIVVANATRLSDGFRLARPEWIGNYYTRALEMDHSGGFPRGQGNIAVSGVWGWLGSEFPAAVNTALLYQMEDMARAESSLLGATAAGFRTAGITNVAQGGLSASVGPSEPVSARVARILRPYAAPASLAAVA